MGYEYEKEKLALFTDEGQKSFIKIRDKAFELLDFSGAFCLEKILWIDSRDLWFHLACIDRMIELGDIVGTTELHRVFIRET